MWPEETCRRPCRAAVRCVWTESCICSAAITPGETPTRCSPSGVCLCVDAGQSCGACEVAIFLWGGRCFALCPADLPAPPQSPQLCLGRNEGCEGTSTFLQGQAGLLGLQEQVGSGFFVLDVCY